MGHARKRDDKALPLLRVYAELQHDSQRIYAEHLGIPDNEIEWIQSEPAIDQWGKVDIE
jgi:hypothetical protein